MTLVELIRKRNSGYCAPATAIPATPATGRSEVLPSAAGAAPVAVARPYSGNHERLATPLGVVIAPTSPSSPLQFGWLVAYRDRQWVLCGGCDDREHGTVQECRWSAGVWTVTLTDGQRLSLASIRSVGKTSGEGELVAAWTVREHGYDGMKGEPAPVVDAAIPTRISWKEAVPAMRAA